MAETINYRVTISPFVSQISSTQKEGEYDIEAILTTADLLTLTSLVNEVAAGGVDASSKTSLSKIAAMLVANTAAYNATNATALADFITAIQAGTDVSSVVTAINAL